MNQADLNHGCVALDAGADGTAYALCILTRFIRMATYVPNVSVNWV